MILAILALMSAQASPVFAAPRDAVVSLKDFREVLASLSQATHVSSRDPDVQRIYSGAVTRFPKTGDITELKTSTVMTLVSLSSIFCKKMIDKDAALTGASLARRYLHKNVDFTKAPAAQDKATRSGVIQDYANVFWLRPATDAEVAAVLDVMSQSEANGTNDLENTKNMYVMACSTMASSVSFLAN